MSVVTRVSFDPTEPHPKFIFRAIKPLTNQDAQAILALREDHQSKRITGEEGKSVPVAQSVLAQPVQPVARVQQQAPVTAAVTQQPVSPPPPPPPPAAAPANNVVPLNGSIMGVSNGPVIEGEFTANASVMAQPAAQPQPQQQQTIQPAAQTTADVGASDVDLDSQIAVFLSKQ
jgi:hypothetical protein